MPLCEGDLRGIDRQISALENQLDAPDEGRIDIYLYAELPEACGGIACFVDGRYIQATWQSLDHELVHAVVAKVADPSDFWSEGVAEALRPRPTRRGHQSVGESVDRDNLDLDYATAGHFVRWLILEQGGIEALLPVLRGKAFADNYGMTLAEAEARYETDAPWSYPSNESCSSMPMSPAASGGGFFESITIECGHPDVSQFIGPGTSRTVEIQNGGEQLLEIQGGLGVRMVRCQTDVLESPPLPSEPGNVPFEGENALPIWQFFSTEDAPHMVQLVPGSYEISLVGDRDAPTPTEMTVSLAPAL